MSFLRPLSLLLTALFIPCTALADVTLPRLLTDGAVLQRDKPLNIWGWADEGEKVRVRFAGHEAVTHAANGHWQVTLPAMPAGGPYQLEVSGKNQLQRNNLLLGDVWIAAGQSNMEQPLNRVRYRYPEVLANTEQPRIREFNVPVAYAFKGPLEDYTQGQWKSATPEQIAGFSAVGFFFAQTLLEQTRVPIGIISIPVGGSPAEAWMSEQALAAYPHYLKQLQPFKDDAHVQATIAQDKANSDQWFAQLGAADEGLKHQWASASLSLDGWQPMQVPGFLREQGSDFSLGAVWVRKSIELSAIQADKKATLWLGAIVDGDQVYVNGHLVGQTGYQYPPRIYAIPEGLLKAGANEIRIRITSYSNNPGFVKDKRYALLLSDAATGEETVSLQGQWHYRIAARMEPMKPSTTLHYQPASLFNAKLAPALPMAIKGVIWYQGESNVDRADAQGVHRQPGGQCAEPSCAVSTSEYRYLFADLIRDWRRQFNQGDFPFLFVQLASFLPARDEPTESKWAQLREAQRHTLELPNTAMAVAIDAGEWNDIHPQDKKTVGERLALGALKVAYGKKLIASGPALDSVSAKGNKVVLRFSEVGRGLKVQGGGALKHIALAGPDKRFVWARAQVKKDQIIVWADGIDEPHWVRYAWADNPEGANLYNSAGLPASPFEASIMDTRQ
ncbi:sialate O-acetylesterase [Cellvibrio japonicus]|uniref:Sialic acid-specific 9-O-acetylesterase n=1 Tax=Cellvibrio japonicus (strain Ueda107) TaxID=498211 RepID=B3PDW1_CELJU|nr:sialate O-acetylesterase [Cellvibrio japonicus]ACE83348.1 sialic acid-specific 9-O-acetylesterase [Cellvibrio japonicus Ueda107]QEI13446.1 9-O-acetylesterase [Cellvibrio japonicus]QEI17020.1 9-O-acetylesterase [Cellvibrio japonicus]QEI20598.1 9-O-acetylesterase [Cellvibrio japonicus]